MIKYNNIKEGFEFKSDVRWTERSEGDIVGDARVICGVSQSGKTDCA